MNVPPLWARVPVTVLAALILSLQSPPLNWHLLQWVGLLPMLWVTRAERPRGNRWLGWLYGLVGVGALFRWLVDTIDLFSNLPMVAAVALLALFAAVFGTPYAVLWGSVHPLRERLGWGWVLAWPALWVVLEWLAMVVFLFPYNHGVGQYRVPWTWQIVGVTGIWGLTFLVFLVNAALAEWMFRLREGRREPPRAALAIAGASLAAVLIYGKIRYDAVEAGLAAAPVLRVAQLQTSTDMATRLEMGGKETFQEWWRKTESIRSGGADLVIWPEGASPYALNTVPGRKNVVSDRLAELAREKRFDLIIGAGAREPVDGRSATFNTVFGFDAERGAVGRYDKMVPLPFGEYLPFGWLVPGLADAIGGIGDFRAGEQPTMIELRGRRYAAPICYEAILPATCRLFDAPDLIVNVTNDAWFGDTAAPHQHAMLAATRAAELGVPLYRSAYTGVSMGVEPHGRIHGETGVFEDVTRVVEVRMATFPTIYARFGDWFVVVCALGLFATGLAVRRSTG